MSPLAAFTPLPATFTCLPPGMASHHWVGVTSSLSALPVAPAIIVAWLSKLNPAAIILVSILFGALQVGGFFVQTMGVPASVAAMLQGAVLFFVVGGEFLTQYRFVISRKEVA